MNNGREKITEKENRLMDPLRKIEETKQLLLEIKEEQKEEVILNNPINDKAW